MKEDKNDTIVDADIAALKEQARKSGLSYNEAIEFIARTTGGRGTQIYSDTDIEAVKRQNEQSVQAKRDTNH